MRGFVGAIVLEGLLFFLPAAPQALNPMSGNVMYLPAKRARLLAITMGPGDDAGQAHGHRFRRSPSWCRFESAAGGMLNRPLQGLLGGRDGLILAPMGHSNDR